MAEERHSVSVVAYIHSVKRESDPGGDQDFHVMLQQQPDGPHRDLLGIIR